MVYKEVKKTQREIFSHLLCVKFGVVLHPWEIYLRSALVILRPFHHFLFTY